MAAVFIVTHDAGRASTDHPARAAGGVRAVRRRPDRLVRHRTWRGTVTAHAPAPAKDDLDRLIDEIEAERPGFRARIEAAVAARVERSITRRVLTASLRAGAGLSVRDAAALLGVTPAGIKVHDGRLQPTRDSSGRRTYDRAAVLALAEERRRKTARSRRRRAS